MLPFSPNSSNLPTYLLEVPQEKTLQDVKYTKLKNENKKLRSPSKADVPWHAVHSTDC